jgi:hypothetical protein
MKHLSGKKLILVGYESGFEARGGQESSRFGLGGAAWPPPLPAQVVVEQQTRGHAPLHLVHLVHASELLLSARAAT